jgi:hypothetical protein
VPGYRPQPSDDLTTPWCGQVIRRRDPRWGTVASCAFRDPVRPSVTLSPASRESSPADPVPHRPIPSSPADPVPPRPIPSSPADPVLPGRSRPSPAGTATDAGPTTHSHGSDRHPWHRRCGLKFVVPRLRRLASPPSLASPLTLAAAVPRRSAGPRRPPSLATRGPWPPLIPSTVPYFAMAEVGRGRRRTADWPGYVAGTGTAVTSGSAAAAARAATTKAETRRERREDSAARRTSSGGASMRGT